MSIQLAETLITAVGAYLCLGVLFALLFLIFGVSRIDPRARGGSVGYRLLVLPGVAALGPYLAWRWIRGKGPPQERTAHRLAAARKEDR